MSSFEALEKNVHRVMAEAHFNLSRCTDMYRLNTIVNTLREDLDKIASETNQCVKELEHG